MDGKPQTKRGTTPLLSVTISGLDEKKTLAKVEFVFKQKEKETSPVLATKVYTGGATDTAVYTDGVFYLSFTEAESRQFKADDTYYMDTRITYTDGSIPMTEIMELYSLPTLFETAEDGDAE